MSERSNVRDWVIDPANLQPITDSTYPKQFHERVRGRVKRRFGKAAGLKSLSIITTELPPGVAASLRMYQTNEDEFIYVLEGTPTLVTDVGEVTLAPGQGVGFPAGVKVGHQIVNRSKSLVRFLEAADIHPDGNESVYTEDDLLQVPNEDGTKRIFVNRKRVPY
jgi:uncharacterized cupin superfamily protein